MSELPIQKWVEEAQQDPKTFEQLYEAFFPRLYTYMRYRVYQAQDAEDLVADVFLKAARQLEQFSWHHDGSFPAWLFRIAHTTVADFYRQQRAGAEPVELEAAAPLQADSLPSEDAIIRAETFEELNHLLKTLSPRRQEVISLKFFGQLRNQEIAAILSLDERTVASHLCRGLRDLQQRYMETFGPRQERGSLR